MKQGTISKASISILCRHENVKGLFIFNSSNFEFACQFTVKKLEAACDDYPYPEGMFVIEINGETTYIYTLLGVVKSPCQRKLFVCQVKSIKNCYRETY